MSPQKLTVSQLARIAGVGPDSIRHYERIGLVPRAERSPAGYRLWTAQEVEYLKWVAPAKRAGFTLHELAKIFRMYYTGSPHVVRLEISSSKNSLIWIRWLKNC
ncbi:MAG: MerR family DNA-binding transcriptional regulator [Candidatus Acidiferrales bacterium]